MIGNAAHTAFYQPHNLKSRAGIATVHDASDVFTGESGWCPKEHVKLNTASHWLRQMPPDKLLASSLRMAFIAAARTSPSTPAITVLHQRM